MYKQISIADMNDTQLLANFVQHGSEPAFRTLVERHLPLVLGTARRITGESGLAEEVAQTVFILLARKAPRLGPGTILSGWLYRTTRFVAARAIVAEQRRRRREQKAVSMQLQNDPDPHWQKVAPQLDHALGRLSETDRNAVLLRYVQECPVRDVGAALGLGEEAAKKRIARALEKLRRILRRRGTEVSAAAFIAGVARESASAAAAGLAQQISAAAVAHATVGAGLTAGTSALVADVLAAWRWAKIKALLAAGAGLLVVASVVPSAFRSAREQASPTLAGPKDQTPSASGRSEQVADNLPATSLLEAAARQGIPLRSLRVTVLDAVSGDPIPGAGLTHSLMWTPQGGTPPPPLRTGPNGTASFPVPERLPGGERMDQFSVFVSAKDYATRTINWLSSTGSVLSLVSTQYTVCLESGIILSGTVVDDAGQPLAGVRIGAIGNSYKGYSYSTDTSGKVISPPVIRQEDFPSYSVNSEGPRREAIVTERQGRFELPHFPSDLRAVVIDLVGPDGARHRFRTPQGKSLTADSLLEVSFQDLRGGTARFVLPRGVTVEGIVLDAAGEPVSGAAVTEGSQWGNLRVLSRSETDSSGRFTLSNRPPREIILAASAEGHASASTAVLVKPGMEQVRIQLAPEQPLRGRLVNEAGHSVPGASVGLVDYLNEGLGLSWSGKTDAEGRFVWRSAPTNEVVLSITTPEPAYRIVRLRPANTEHLITLRPGITDVVRVTGKVRDAESGEALGRFRVKISYCMSGDSPDPARRTVEGVNGEYDLRIANTEIPVGSAPAWVLVVEADGYDPVFSRLYEFEEGDQQLDFSLRRGGTIQGVVKTPEGEPAASARLAVAQEANAVLSSRPGELSAHDSGQQSDAEGRFRLSKPLKAHALVAFHDTGWAIIPLSSAAGPLEVRLLPWGRIEGTALSGGAPLTGEHLELNKLTWDWSDALQVLRHETTDAEGRFVFDKLPAGEFQLALDARVRQRPGPGTVKALQTPVTVCAGETQHVQIATSGRLVLARLRAGRSIAAPAWADAFAVLSRDVPVPREPGRSDYISNASHLAARHRYAHDPAVLAALREQRSFIGNLAADGTVTFENIPPGRYVLEVKLLTKSAPSAAYDPPQERPATGQLRTVVSIPEPTDLSGAPAPVALGEFILEPL
jgi:RNA polymerase sigma factor (sigma-70 family)